MCQMSPLLWVGLQVFGRGHGRRFTHIPEETAQLQTKLFAPLPPKNLLLILRLTVQSNRTQLIEVSSEDIKEFNTMVTQKKVIGIVLEKYEER